MNGVTAEHKSIYEDFAAFGCVFGLGKNVRIVAPESVKEKMKKRLRIFGGCMNQPKNPRLISFIKRGELYLERIKPRELSAVNRCNSQVK